MSSARSPWPRRAQRLIDSRTRRSLGSPSDGGLQRRYAEVYRHGHAQFEPGQAQFCVAQKNRPGSEYRATFENAIHMVDLLRWFCGGEATSVSAHAIAQDPYQEDGIAALIRFSTGSIGSLVAARTAGSGTSDSTPMGDPFRSESSPQIASLSIRKERVSCARCALVHLDGQQPPRLSVSSLQSNTSSIVFGLNESH